jgi:hypothetical protein
MAFGSSSAMFREFAKAMVENSPLVSAAAWGGLDGDTIKAALFNDTTTPDKDAAVANTGYNASVWTSTNAVSDSDGSSDWPAAGITLTSKAITTPSTGVIMFDAADTTHSNTVTITNAYGCLVYDDSVTSGTVADQGISFHSFGGAQSVTTGTFTIVWHANGLFRITV